MGVRHGNARKVQAYRHTHIPPQSSASLQKGPGATLSLTSAHTHTVQELIQPAGGAALQSMRCTPPASQSHRPRKTAHIACTGGLPCPRTGRPGKSGRRCQHRAGGTQHRTCRLSRMSTCCTDSDRAGTVQTHHHSTWLAGRASKTRRGTQIQDAAQSDRPARVAVHRGCCTCVTASNGKPQGH